MIARKEMSIAIKQYCVAASVAGSRNSQQIGVQLKRFETG